MMNELIKDLAEHCDFYVGNEHYDKPYEAQQRLFIEKFAELIVQECATWIVENAISINDLGPEYFAKAMKKFFGVG